MSQLTKLEEVRYLKSALVLDIKIQSLEFVLLFLWSCFGKVFPHYALFPLFWNGDGYPVPLCAENM